MCNVEHVFVFQDAVKTNACFVNKQLFLNAFCEKVSVVKHEGSPAKKKPFMCSVCSEDLKGRERSHTRKKPFVCSLCCRRFGRKNTLTRHKSTEKPFVCASCGKVLNATSVLSRHKNSHRREAVRLLVLRWRGDRERESWQTWKNSHWKKTVLLYGLGLFAMRSLVDELNRHETSENTYLKTNNQTIVRFQASRLSSHQT